MDTEVEGDRKTPLWSWLGSLGRRRQFRLTAFDRALIGAHGKALTTMVVGLQARGHLDVKEFADMLGLFSVVVADDDDLESSILAVWAGFMKDAIADPST
ncbi:MAG: hypothetical protein J0G33_09000 [Afipia felis]|jgi:hypothetical protein|uniref:hypothetical protein n=1 Tax=Rhizobium sp. WW_1 TaxID=1907375 RepID=UPI0006492148|nr:hypothetical protein [Rhizobium sp. WW_1]MBN9603054.1 hypothetical protein [Afipia felis]MBX9876263.1 hypothetical protein [Beijerinckiaceae bacterium]RKD74876.1 hypothetical protein BJ928_1011233 [Rhizobium sp. WW_1]